jgi:hypothetical protein
MIRFSDQDAGSVILCNSPMYNNIYCSTLSVTNDVTFHKVPKVKDVSLVTATDFNELKNTVKELNNKIITGTQSPEQFFEENPSLPEGTIYLQIEKTED